MQTTTAASKGQKLSPEQLKKMQQGLKKYRKAMDGLRDKAAAKAKITPKQYAAYLKALRSDECKSEGPLAAVKAAEIAKISEVKFKAFTKIYKDLRKAYKDDKAVSKSNAVVLTPDDVKTIKLVMKSLSAQIHEHTARIKQAKTSVQQQKFREMVANSKQRYNSLFTVLSNAVVEGEATKPLPPAKVSPTTQELLDKPFRLATIMNLIQSDKFFDWFSGDFSAWMNEEGTITDDQVVQWVAANLK